MSRFTAFCNNTTDLQAVVGDIDRYDRKRVLAPNWITTDTSHLYQLMNTGHVEQLYRDGIEMTAVTDTPNADNEYNYSSSTDSFQFYLASSSVSALNSSVFEAGQDWDGLKTTVCKEQADRMRSYLNRPIYKRGNSTYQGASARDYDFIVVRINAILSCADLIMSQDPERAEIIEQMAISPDGNGLLDKLKRNEYVLWNETSYRSESGVISEVSINASSTGYIEDIKLNTPPLTDYDEVRVIISTAGTFSVGSASTVKYDVFVKDSTGLKTHKVVDGEIITGDYQSLAYGAKIRFQAGVYTINDEWAITFQSSEIPIGQVKSGQIYR
tara:strand:- start:15407 stop:16387 length:981 start_codon:yes stop_codon:yes gene_type:complete